MENISSFLNALPAFGVRPEDTFQTADLFEGVNMAAVCPPRNEWGHIRIRVFTPMFLLSQVQVCIENVRRIAELKAKVCWLVRFP